MSRLNEGLYSSSDQTWMTPPEIWGAPLRLPGMPPRYDVDVACTLENVAAGHHLKEHEVDSLDVQWHQMGCQQGKASPICWMNPPYGTMLRKFLKKAHEEARAGARIWALVPARTETKYQHLDGIQVCNFTVLIYQRISFIPSESMRAHLIEKRKPKVIADWQKAQAKKYASKPVLPGLEKYTPDPEWVQKKAEHLVDTGNAPFPSMLCYYGHDWREQLAKWEACQPIKGTAMVTAARAMAPTV